MAEEHELYDETVPAANVNINLAGAAPGSSRARDLIAAGIGGVVVAVAIVIGTLLADDDDDDEAAPAAEAAAMQERIDEAIEDAVDAAFDAQRAARPSGRAHELLNSVLWAQTSAEYRALCRQIYATARTRLDEALEKKWRAALEQGDAPPPDRFAIVLDLDETVLDNIPYQGQLVRDATSFSSVTWRVWARLGTAEAVPGAVGFVQYALRKGVAVFFITNRNKDEEEGTRRNLERLGLPVSDDPDNVLTRGERDGWGSDKASRRAFVAKDYHIVLLVGDAANDFFPVGEVEPEERCKRAASYAEYWGRRWILLPNPYYGGWEGSLYRFEYGLDDKAKLGLKRGRVRGFK